MLKLNGIRVFGLQCITLENVVTGFRIGYIDGFHTSLFLIDELKNQ